MAKDNTIIVVLENTETRQAIRRLFTEFNRAGAAILSSVSFEPDSPARLELRYRGQLAPGQEAMMHNF